MKIYFFSIFLYCLYFIHCNLRNSNMRRNQAAVVSFDLDRQYLGFHWVAPSDYQTLL